MFRRLREPSDKVTILFDGHPLSVASGETLAAALLASGVSFFRSSVVGKKPRAPYCMIGVCHECLVTIDGMRNRQSCLVEVREGMVVESQHGLVTIDARDGQ